MTSIKNFSKNEQISIWVYFLLTAITSVPVWLAIQAYLEALHTHLDEAAATAATFCFFAGVFLGRYFGLLWTANNKPVTNSLLTILALVMVLNFTWLFVHADYPMENNRAVGLLLYWLPFLLFSVSLGMLIKLARGVSQNQLKEARTLAAQSQSELHLLQSQLSPHFLFNTLNNMYGLSITQHEKVPALLLKLSELLRYSVYDANEIFVPLKDELAYIRNYIDFEQLRLGDRLVLTTDLEEVRDSTVKIAPMLLIVFIENAFKHSKNTTEHEIFITITMKTWANYILFTIENSRSRVVTEEQIDDKHSGFGLANVNKRLALLYPGEHGLEIEDGDTEYTVNLRLKIK
ncbi:MAG: histidine kinase [Dyadobacter sp.]|uniref:sensor histidine kinase n=1 Tax=Dyadobacter sp. TaxID=1914288 RepID=UPI003267D37D